MTQKKEQRTWAKAKKMGEGKTSEKNVSKRTK